MVFVVMFVVSLFLYVLQRVSNEFSHFLLHYTGYQ